MATEDEDGSLVQQVVLLNEESARLKREMSELESRLFRSVEHDAELNIRSTHVLDNARDVLAHALHLMQ